MRRAKNFQNSILPLIVNCLMAQCILHNICMVAREDQSDSDDDSESDVDSSSSDDDDSDTDDSDYEYDNVNALDRRQQIFDRMFGN